MSHPKITLVTGSSGFIGTNLVKTLLDLGHYVIAVDNFSSSEKWKSEIFESTNYEFIEADITSDDFIDTVKGTSFIKEFNRLDQIFNLACPASPYRYIELSLETIEANTDGMFNILNLAKEFGSVVLHTSTSEIYGEPEVHPQIETYRGNVNTVGPRSCYDEGKRLSETICYEYKRLFNSNIKIVRIFNTYGPYMDPKDGRVITNFITQALKGEDLTIYGDGSATRSFQYIDDLIDGFLKFIETDKDIMGPINLGNPNEFSMKELAELVLSKIDTKSQAVFIEPEQTNPYNKQNDPQRRRPDITLAKKLLNGWEPKVSLDDGLVKTIEYYRKDKQ